MQNIIKLTVLILMFVVPASAFAEEELIPITEEEAVPFTIGAPIAQGNGCPDGTYDVVLSPDGNELTVLFSSFTAETNETENFNFSNCNIAVPIEVPAGITIGLFGVDYRGMAFIPTDGTGIISREYFFAGVRGPQINSAIPVYDEFYEFFYPDEVTIPVWTRCGDDVTARSNTTMYVSKPADSPVDAFISMFSEDWTIDILFHLTWEYCEE